LTVLQADLVTIFLAVIAGKTSALRKFLDVGASTEKSNASNFAEDVLRHWQTFSANHAGICRRKQD